MDDNYRKMLRAMDEQLYSVGSAQREIERLLTPQLDFQNQISKLAKPYDLARSFLDEIDSPVAKLQEEMQRHLCSTSQIQEHLQSFLENRFSAQKQLEELLQPQRWIQDQLSDLMQSQQSSISSLRDQLEPISIAGKHIADLIEPLNRYLTEFQDLDIEVDSVGNVFIDGDEVSAEEISQTANAFVAQRGSIRDFVEGLVTWLSQLNPLLRYAVMLLVLPYIVSVVANLTTPLYQEWWRGYQNQAPRSAKKQIILDANQLYHRDELSRYRFVNASTLNVRSGAHLKAEIIDNLPFGKSVLVIRREKAWTNIEYLDESTGEPAIGWVYSRYLHKFDK